MSDNEQYLGGLQLAVHPLRDDLYKELHARPFPLVATPCRITYIAILNEAGSRKREIESIRRLCERYAVQGPEEGDAAFYENLGDFTLRWESHSEFSSYTFIQDGSDDRLFASKAIDSVPVKWLEELEGKVVVAMHGAVESVASAENFEFGERVAAGFDGERLNGSFIDKQRGAFCTSLSLHAGGYGRFYIANFNMSKPRAGRALQRILEIETYRLLALLALPQARAISPKLVGIDRCLVDLTHSIAHIKDPTEERALLDGLSDKAAKVEKYRSDIQYRFSATKAYFALVQQRVTYLDESPIASMQTLGQFFARRLTPAMDTCDAVHRNLEELSQSLVRASGLLRARVDMTIEKQNQDLLTTMSHRAKLQLRMQETVEGFSVVAITYYLVGLVKYVVEGSVSASLVDKDFFVAVAVAPIFALVWGVTRQIKKRITRAQ